MAAARPFLCKPFFGVIKESVIKNGYIECVPTKRFLKNLPSPPWRGGGGEVKLSFLIFVSHLKKLYLCNKNKLWSF